MLPRLAEIFGITTDALLGMEPQAENVHEAEVVDDGEKHDFEVNMSSKEHPGNWTFHWDSGRKGAVLFGILVLWVGALTLLSKICQWDVSFWSILWPSALVIYGLDGLLIKFSIFGLGCTLFGGYSLVANLHIWKLDIAGDLVFPIMLLLFGVGLLIDALKRPKKSRFSVTRNGKDAHETTYKCDGNTDRFSCSLSFGEKTHLVNLHTLAEGDATVSFGELTVDLSGVGSIQNDCCVLATCSFGELRILVPRRFRVEPHAGAAFANLNVVGHPDPQPEGIIHLDANASFGEIEIRYI